MCNANYILNNTTFVKYKKVFASNNRNYSTCTLIKSKIPQTGVSHTFFFTNNNKFYLLLAQ